MRGHGESAFQCSFSLLYLYVSASPLSFVRKNSAVMGVGQRVKQLTFGRATRECLRAQTNLNRTAILGTEDGGSCTEIAVMEGY